MADKTLEVNCEYFVTLIGYLVLRDGSILFGGISH